MLHDSNQQIRKLKGAKSRRVRAAKPKHDDWVEEEGEQPEKAKEQDTFKEAVRRVDL
jgi:hypothetical protein